MSIHPLRNRSSQTKNDKRARIWDTSLRKELARDLAVINVAGSEQDMGAQLGSAYRQLKQWEPVMAYYERMASIAIGEDSRLIRRLVQPIARAGMHALHRQLTPAQRARAEAFSRALGVSSRVPQALQVFDTMQNLASIAGRVPGSPLHQQTAARAPSMCTSLAVWGKSAAGGQLLHGRNFDLPGVGIYDQVPAVVFCSPVNGLRYGYVTARGGDALHISSFNEAGLSFTTHNRFHRSATFRGAPLWKVAHRVLSEAKTLAEAEAIVRDEAPIASTYGILISSASEHAAISIETCGSRVAVVRPQTDCDWLPVTNHYFDPEITKRALTPTPAFQYSSESRWHHMNNVGRGGDVDVETMMEALSSFTSGRGQERATGGVVTQVNNVHSVVMAPHERAVYISVGAFPCSGGPWQRVPWQWSEAPGTRTIESPRPNAKVVTESHEAKAFRLLVEAARAPWAPHSPAPETTFEQLDAACTLVPDDPSYRALAAGAALRIGALDQAHEHLAHGLRTETDPFYQAQLNKYDALTLAALGHPGEANHAWQALQSSDYAERLSGGRTHAAASRRQLAKTKITCHVAGLS